MAKKKQNVIDDSFDLDQMEDFDFDFPDPNIKDDRKPITKVVTGIKEGAKSQVRSAAFIKEVMKNTFPASIGAGIDMSEDVARSSKNLYDESVKEIKPTMTMARKTISKLVPKDSAFVSKDIQTILDKWRNESDDSAINDRTNKESIRETALGATLKDMFAVQEKAEAARTAQLTGRDNLKIGLDQLYHRTQLSALNQAAMSLKRLEGYNTTVGLNYQKKSLELQYRQLFVAQDLLEFQKLDASKRDTYLASISKNTGLPDFIKATSGETRKEVRRKKLFDMYNNVLFGGADAALKTGLDNLKKTALDSIKTLAADFQSGLQDASMAGEMTSGMGLDPATEVGKMLGSSLTQKAGNTLGSKLAGKIKGSKLDNKLGITDKLNRLESSIVNLPNAINEFKKDRSGVYDDSMKGSLLSALRDLIPSMDADKGLVAYNTKNLGEHAEFDNAAHRSITEVIPGFLARIYRELQVTRTGNTGISLTDFSHDTGVFVDRGVLEKEIDQKVAPNRAIRRTKDSLIDIIAMIDPRKEMSEEETRALKKRLLHNAADKNSANKERLGEASQYEGENDKVAKAVASRMEKYLEGVSSEERTSFIRKHNRLADDVSDPRQLLQSLLESGNIEQLRKGNLIKEEGEGPIKDVKVNIDEVLRRYLDDPTQLSASGEVGDSSFIGPVAPTSGERLAKQVTSKLSRATDKASSGIKGLATGVIELKNKGLASAKSAKANFTMPGFSMPEIPNIGFGQFVSNAKGHTTSMLDKIPNRDDLLDGVKTAGTKASVIGKDSADKLKYSFESAKANASKFLEPSKYSDLYFGDEKSPRIFASKMAQGLYFLKDSGKPLLDMSELSGAVMDDKYNEVVTAEEVPKLMHYDQETKSMVKAQTKQMGFGKIVNDLAGSFKAGAINLGKSAIDSVISAFNTPTAADVYVNGEKEPRLYAVRMNQGLYTDAETEQVIHTPQDIKGPVKDENGQLVLTKGDLGNLFTYNFSIRKWGPLGIAKSIIEKLWYFQTKVAPKWAMWNLKQLGKLTKAAGRMAIRAGAFMLGIKMTPKPSDVYIAGESTPRLEGSRFSKGEYFDRNTGAVLKNENDIKGPVVDKKGVTLIDEDDLKNLVSYSNTLGKFSPLRLLKLAGLPIKAALWLAKKATDFGFKATKSIISKIVPKAGKVVGGIASGAARGLGALLGIKRKARAVGAQAQDTEKLRANSALDRIGKSKAMKDGDASWRSSIADRLKSKMSARTAAGGTGIMDMLSSLSGVISGVVSGFTSLTSLITGGGGVLGALGKFASFLGPVGAVAAAGVAGYKAAKALGADKAGAAIGGKLADLTLDDPIAEQDRQLAKDNQWLKDNPGKKLPAKTKPPTPGQKIASALPIGGAQAATVVNPAAPTVPTPPKATDVPKVDTSIKAATTVGTSPDAEVKPTSAAPTDPAGADKKSAGTVGNLPAAPGPVLPGENGVKFAALNSGVKIDGINPELRKNLFGMVEEYGNTTGKKVPITDGFRSFDDQMRMKSKYGPRAAAPGNSPHEYGLAIDADSKVANEMEQLGLMRKYGFTRPVGAEPWHLEPIGIQDDINKYKKDPAAASEVIAGSLGRGGGGIGTDPSAKPYSRNRANSLAIANAPSSMPEKTSTEKSLFSTPSGPVKGADGTGSAPSTATAGYGASASVLSATNTLKTPPSTPSAIVRDPGSRQGAAGSSDAEGKPDPTKAVAIKRPDGSGISGSVTSLQNGPADPSIKVPDATGPGAAGMKPMIHGAAKLVGVDPNALMQVIAMESGFKTGARAGTSSATGLGQFTAGTWKEMMSKYANKYGIDPNTSPNDPKASAIMAAQYLKDNAQAIGKATGMPVGSTEAYIGHFLGTNGAIQFLKALKDNPEASAAQAMPKQANANKEIFFENGRQRTNAEVYALLEKRIRDKTKAFGIDPPANDTSMVAGASPPAKPSTTVATADSLGAGESIVPSDSKPSSSTTAQTVAAPSVPAKPPAKPWEALIDDKSTAQISQEMVAQANAPAPQPDTSYMPPPGAPMAISPAARRSIRSRQWDDAYAQQQAPRALMAPINPPSLPPAIVPMPASGMFPTANIGFGISGKLGRGISGGISGNIPIPPIMQAMQAMTRLSGPSLPAIAPAMPEAPSGAFNAPFRPIPTPQQQTVGGMDASLFVKTEGILSQQLTVQMEMRDSLKQLVQTGIGSKAEAPNAPAVPADQGRAPAAPAGAGEAYAVPRGIVSMKRAIA